MAKPETSPFLPAARPEVFPVSLALAQEDVDWLDAQAEHLNRSRSDVLREIIRHVRGAS